MVHALPKISVILPFRNCEAYLDKAIQSVLNQTFRDFELILINDASTDHSDTVAKKYLYDTRIRYFTNKEHKGFSDTLNFAISMARGGFIARMDGDDISDETRFEKQFQFINEKNLDLVGTFAHYIDETGALIHKQTEPVDIKDIKEQIFKRCPIMHPTILARKEIFKNNKYSPDFFPREDHHLFFRLLTKGYRFGNMPQFLFYYRVHKRNTYFKNPWMKVRVMYKIRREMIKKYFWKPSFEEYFIMYADLALSFFPNKFRFFCEKTYRKLFDPPKIRCEK